MPTLFLTPRYSEDSQALWKAAAQLGWQTERLSTWRIHEHWQGSARANPGSALVYGEAMFAPELAAQLGYTLHNPPEDWLVTLPYAYRLRNIALCTLADARQLNAPAFVKPPNDKSFPAAVYCGHELPREFDDEMAVLIADVVRWECEFRCFILDRELATFSIYARLGALQRDAQFHSEAWEDQAAQAFIEKMLADPRVPLPRATVIDIGLIADQGWACVEQNAAWGAGIYGCDPQAVLRVLAKTCSD
jgi:ATP-grasp domain, R2K clade family 2